MKKILLVLLIMASLVSCKMQILDPDGWVIYQMGWAIDYNQAIVQSHDGFIVDDIFYNEVIIDDKVVIKNPLNHSINVKITTQEKVEWIIIEAKSRYKIVIEKED